MSERHCAVSSDMAAAQVRLQAASDAGDFEEHEKAKAEIERLSARNSFDAKRAAKLADDHRAQIIEGAKRARAALLSGASEIVEAYRRVDALQAQAGQQKEIADRKATEFRRGLIDCCQIIAGGSSGSAIQALFDMHYRTDEMLLLRLSACRAGDLEPLYAGIVSKDDASLAASAEYTVARLSRAAREVQPK
jgi:hypothetical protein